MSSDEKRMGFNAWLPEHLYELVIQVSDNNNETLSETIEAILFRAFADFESPCPQCGLESVQSRSKAKMGNWNPVGGFAEYRNGELVFISKVTDHSHKFGEPAGYFVTYSATSMRGDFQAKIEELRPTDKIQLNIWRNGLIRLKVMGRLVAARLPRGGWATEELRLSDYEILLMGFATRMIGEHLPGK